METVEQLIKERTFDSLTGEELASVKELCGTEEEFLTMQRFFRELDTVTASGKTIINPEIKNSLDGIFSAKHPGIRANWTAPETVAAPVAPVIPLHQRTWVRIAAVAVLILGTAPFWNMLRNDVPARTAQTARLSEPKTSEKNSYGAVLNPTTEEAGAPEQPGSFKAELPADADRENTVTWASTSPGDAPAAPTYEWQASPSPETSYKRFDKKEVADGMFGVSTKESEKGATTALNFNRMIAAEPELRAGFSYSANIGNATSKKADNQLFYSFSDAGTQADLHPNASLLGADITVTAYSLAEQPDDLLDLLVPAF